MFCIGASFNRVDQTDLFIGKQGIWLGYTDDEAPSLTRALAALPVGSIVAIKSFAPNVGLIIKAVGIIKNSEWYPLETGHSYARQVKWLWTGEKRFERINDKLDPHRSGTMYQEINPDLIQEIISLISW